MFGRKKKSRSLFKRLIYFVLLASGSGAGIGGWALKDHPAVKALLAAVTGSPDDDNPSDVEKALVGDVADLLSKNKGADFRRAGVYQVTINKVELDQGLFKPGHTVDIQAKVTKARPARPGHDRLGIPAVWRATRGRRQGCPDCGLAQSPIPG